MKTYLLKLKGLIFVQVLFSLLCTLMLATLTYLHKLLFDYDFSRGINGILLLILGYAGCMLFGSIFQYISQTFEWRTCRAFKIMIKKDLFSVITKISHVQFETKNIGEYISILNNNVATLESEYVSGITDILRSSVMLIVYSVFLFIFVDYRIATVILLASLFSVFIPMLTSKKLAALRKTHLKAL